MLARQFPPAEFGAQVALLGNSDRLPSARTTVGKAKAMSRAKSAAATASGDVGRKADPTLLPLPWAVPQRKTDQSRADPRPGPHLPSGRHGCLVCWLPPSSAAQSKSGLNSPSVEIWRRE